MENKISFKSNIKFVSEARFRKVVKGSSRIGFMPHEKFVKQADRFYTKGIRSCTGEV